MCRGAFQSRDNSCASEALKALSFPFAGLQEARKCAHYCVLMTIPAIKNQETLENRLHVNWGFGWKGEKRLMGPPWRPGCHVLYHKTGTHSGFERASLRKMI